MKADLVHGQKHRRRSGVVVTDVVGHIGEADPEPDPRGLMAHGVRAVERPQPDQRISHVELQVRRLPIGVSRMHPIDDHHVVRRVDQCVDDV